MVMYLLKVEIEDIEKAGETGQAMGVTAKFADTRDETAKTTSQLDGGEI